MPEITDGWSLISIAVCLAVAGLLYGINRLSRFLQKKSDNDLLDRGIQGFDNVLTMVVREQNQAYKKDMKKARDPNSPGGASITRDEAEKLKKGAVNRLVAYFGLPGLMKIAAAFGAAATDKKEVESFLETAVESKVDELKKKEEG